MSDLRSAAFRLGARLRHYQLIRWTVAGLEHVVSQAVKIIQWSVIAIFVVGVIALVGFLIVQLNYAPLWLRVYRSCVDAQPEAVSITESLRHHSECIAIASSVTGAQMKLDQTPRGTKR